MLKNKFSVLKSIALALVLVMAVAVFAACGDKTDDDAVNSALADLSKQAYESSVELSKQQSIQDEEIKKAQSSIAQAQEEASKAQSEAAASISKAQEEASKAQSRQEASLSSALESIKKSQEEAATATTAPGAAEDLSTLMSELAELRAKYQYAYADYYIGDNHAKVIKVLDLATYQLGNAKTLAAGKDILAQAKVDLAAIENAVTVANAFNAQVEALGDIEADVFTTAAEKVAAARKAYDKFVKDYTAAKVESSSWVKELGLAATVTDLQKAELKLAALADYIAASLEKDMAALYVGGGKKVREPRDVNGVITNTDADYKFGANDSKTVSVKANTTYAEIIASAYYKYQVLAAVNGGSTVDADLAIDWEAQLGEDGKKTGKVDADKPTEFFTTEELVEYYILPWAEEKFETYKNTWLAALTAKANDTVVAAALQGNGLMLESTKVGTVTLKKDVLFADVDVDVRDIVDAFEDELDALTFAKDFKASSTLEEAEYALFVRASLAYVNAVNQAVANFKEAAIENTNDKVDDAIRALDEDKPVEAAKIANLQSAVTEFVAKVNAIKGYDSTTIFDDDVFAAYKAAKKNEKTLVDFATILESATDLDVAFDKVVTYVNDVEALAIANGIKGVTGGGSGYDTSDAELKELVLAMIDDLNLFKEKFTTEDGGASYEGLRGSKVENPYTETYYTNDAKIEALAKTVDEYIAKIQDVKVSAYAEKKVTMKAPAEIPANKTGNNTKIKKDAALYFASQAAYDYAVAEGIANEAGYDDLLTGKYLVGSNTNLPFTYTQTAGEQAIMEVYSIYKAAYTEFAKQINSMMGYTSSATNGINTAAVKALKNATAGTALNTEITALIDKYTKDIAAVTYTSAGIDDGYKTIAVKNDYANVEDHITTNSTNVDLANSFDYAQMYSAMQTLMTKVSDQTANTSVFALVTLWDYKVEQVAAIKTAAENAVATYELVKAGTGAVATDKLVVATLVNADYGYVFTSPITEYGVYVGYNGPVGTAPTTKDTSYEEKLTKLVAEYEAKIMAITFNNTKITVKNWNDVEIKKDIAGGWNLTNTKTQVDAYVTDFRGTGTKTKVTTTGTSGLTITVAENAKGNVDSRIFKAWFDTFATSYIYTTKTLG